MKITLIGTLPPLKSASARAVALLPAFGAPPSDVLHSPYLHLHPPEAMGHQGKG